MTIDPKRFAAVLRTIGQSADTIHDAFYEMADWLERQADEPETARTAAAPAVVREALEATASYFSGSRISCRDRTMPPFGDIEAKVCAALGALAAFNEQRVAENVIGYVLLDSEGRVSFTRYTSAQHAFRALELSDDLVEVAKLVVIDRE